MLYHYTFNTYSGKQTLEDKLLRDFLKSTFAVIAADKGFEIIECEILCDHVHMLIEQSYLLSTSSVMKSVKGISARRLFQEFRTNGFEHRKLWGRSFHARKISSDEKAAIIGYIKKASEMRKV